MRISGTALFLLVIFIALLIYAPIWAILSIPIFLIAWIALRLFRRR